MKPMRIGALLGALLVLGLSLATVAHFPVLPPVSDGGELAYVRNYDVPGNATNISDDERVTGIYVAYSLTAETGSTDDIEHFDSRGRMADTETFHRIELEDGMLEADNRCFYNISQYDKGALVSDSDLGTVTLFNGVNSALGIQAKQNFTAELMLGGGLDVEVVDEQRIEMTQDGHTYVVEIVSGNGTLTVDPNIDADVGTEGELHQDVTDDEAVNAEASIEGERIIAELGAGADLRGWINAEYPATTQVTNHHLDHISAFDDPCAFAAE